jgi:trehalose 6-phosphate synthase
MARIFCVSSQVFFPDSPHRNASTECVRAALKQQGGGVWFGWDGRITHSRAPDIQQVVRRSDQDGITYLTLPLLEQEHYCSYRRIHDTLLWSLMHHLPDSGTPEENVSALFGYRHVNYLYASHLHPFLQPGDVIWIHDCHLIPLGDALRSLGVENRIVYFHHDPVPEAKTIRGGRTPKQLRDIYDDLVKKLFAYDQVGFQSFRDLHHFMDYIGYKGTMPDYFSSLPMAYGMLEAWFGVFPASIATHEIEMKAWSEAGSDASKAIRQKLNGRALIAGVAPVEYSSGLINGMRGLSKFLAGAPQMRKKICYAPLLPLSCHSSLSEAPDIARALAEHIGGDIVLDGGGPMPVARVLSYLRHARVALVTPLLEGQDMIAKEFLAVQNPHDPGVLILSQYAGAAEELADHGVLLVDPHDPGDIAKSIAHALEMPQEERVQRHVRTLAYLRSHDLAHWSHNFLGYIDTSPAPVPARGVQRSAFA